MKRMVEIHASTSKSRAALTLSRISGLELKAQLDRIPPRAVVVDAEQQLGTWGCRSDAEQYLGTWLADRAHYWATGAML